MCTFYLGDQDKWRIKISYLYSEHSIPLPGMWKIGSFTLHHRNHKEHEWKHGHCDHWVWLHAPQACLLSPCHWHRAGKNDFRIKSISSWVNCRLSVSVTKGHLHPSHCSFLFRRISTNGIYCWDTECWAIKWLFINVNSALQYKWYSRAGWGGFTGKGSPYTVDNRHHTGKMGFALMYQCKWLRSWQELIVQ